MSRNQWCRDPCLQCEKEDESFVESTVMSISRLVAMVVSAVCWLVENKIVDYTNRRNTVADMESCWKLLQNHRLIEIWELVKHWHWTEISVKQYGLIIAERNGTVIELLRTATWIWKVWSERKLLILVDERWTQANVAYLTRSVNIRYNELALENCQLDLQKVPTTRSVAYKEIE